MLCVRCVLLRLTNLRYRIIDFRLEVASPCAPQNWFSFKVFRQAHCSFAAEWRVGISHFFYISSKTSKWTSSLIDCACCVLFSLAHFRFPPSWFFFWVLVESAQWHVDRVKSHKKPAERDMPMPYFIFLYIFFLWITSKIESNFCSSLRLLSLVRARTTQSRQMKFQLHPPKRILFSAVGVSFLRHSHMFDFACCLAPESWKFIISKIYKICARQR